MVAVGQLEVGGAVATADRSLLLAVYHSVGHPRALNLDVVAAAPPPQAAGVAGGGGYEEPLRDQAEERLRPRTPDPGAPPVRRSRGEGDIGSMSSPGYLCSA